MTRFDVRRLSWPAMSCLLLTAALLPAATLAASNASLTPPH